MSDVNQESGVKHIIITIPITAAEGGGGGHIEMSLEDFCKLDISQNMIAHLQQQSHDSGTQLSDNQQSPSDNSPNIIFPSQEIAGGCGARGAHHGIGGARHHCGGGGGHRHVDPPMQVSVLETGRISTDFAFDNPRYSLSDRDTLRDSTLTKIRSPSANSGEGDVLSCIIEVVALK